MYDLRNTLPNRKALDPESQIRLSIPDEPDLTVVTPSNSYHTRMHFSFPTKDPDSGPTPALLTHSAARHKMAVRPKKKGPTRFRRTVESANNNNLDVTPAVSQSLSSDNNTEMYNNDSVVVRSTNSRKTSTDIGLAGKSDYGSPRPDRLSKERPKSMVPLSTQPHYTLGSPPKSAMGYFEGITASNRNYKSPTNYNSKSEEHLQEKVKDTTSNVTYVKPTSAAAASPCISKITSGGRRRSVEKSQSFKIFSNNEAPQDHLENVTDRRELFHMNRPVSYKEFPKPQLAPRSDLRSGLDNSPIKQLNISPEREIIPIVKSNNIIQIEENIDKLVSSPFIPRMKKSPVPYEEPKSPRNINNISITVNRGAGSYPAERISILNTSVEETCPLKTSSVVNSRPRSSSNMEKSPSVGSLNTLGAEDNKVPEFLRIHLNRVENARPKSSIVLYKGSSDTLPRRFSRELESTKPPLPPTITLSTLKRPSINKSRETITEKNSVIIVSVLTPSPALKSTVDVSSKTVGQTNQKDTVISPTLLFVKSGLLENKIATVTPISTPGLPMPSKPDTVFLRDDFSERKGSVSEEKAKIERRLSIVDDKNMARKKSIPTTAAVIANGSNKCATKGDNTPELMKVFARRSMKIKDGDDEPEAVQKSPSVAVQTSESRSSMITDSDKENQSSRREELSLKPRVTEDLPSVAKELKSKNGENLSYRTRTFIEVKNMLQSAYANGIMSNVSAKPRAMRVQKVASALISIEKVNTVTEAQVISDADILPEFKRIVERREEWESRAKMWK